MKKRIVMLSAALALTVGMTAFAQETEGVTEAPAQETEGTTGVSAQEAEQAASALSDDWKDYQIEIDGQVYQFPMTMEAFLACGWECEDDLAQELEPYQYGNFVFVKDDMKIYAELINFGKNTVAAQDCLVGGLTVDSYYWADCTKHVELAGSIERLVSDGAAIEAAWGTPSDTYEGELYTSYTYETDLYSSIELSVYKESGVLEEIDISNLVEPEGFDAGEVSTEVPEAVAAYQKPEALSEDPTAYEISMDGTVYAMPVPVSVLIADGWELDTAESDAEISAGYFGWVTLRRGGQEIRTTASNPEKCAVLPENSWVESLEVGGYELEAEGALPGGVKTGMSEADFLALLEANSLTWEVSESGDYAYYSYNAPEYGKGFEVLVYHGEDDFTPDSVVRVTCSNSVD